MRSGNTLITHIPILCKVFEGPTLSLGDEKCGENACEHEGRENLHDVVEPWVVIALGGTTSAKRGDGTLGNDRANLSGASGDTVGG